MGVLTARFGDECTVQDAVADAFADAWQHWDTVGRYDKPLQWVYKVARQRLARTNARRTREDELLRILAWTTPENHDQVMADVEQRIVLSALLRQLPPRRVEVLALYYPADYSTQEIAGIFGVKAETVRSHLNQGRTQLRRALEQVWPPKEGAR